MFNPDNKLVVCPYDEAHKVKASRLQLHIAKCKLNHLDMDKVPCPFNATHLFTSSERDFHLMNCPDRAPLDRKVSQNALDQNNPFKGCTAVPTFSDPVDLEEESWDDDGVDSFVLPKEAPPGSIIEPRPMAKPAERRRLYNELHRMTTEADNGNSASPSASASASKPSPVPRQPKQPSEVQKLQNVQQQQVNAQAIQNLGLGRGRSTRIAANIFDNKNGIVQRVENASYSNIVKDMSNLGLGRGQNTSQTSVPLLDDDDFPALGCGRGSLPPPKQSVRLPGAKPKK